MLEKTHRFVLEVYETTKSFPKSEIYGLTSQFKRAAVSIAANIAEGFRKRNKINYLNIAQGSLEECKYYIILSEDLGYYKNSTLTNLSVEVIKLLSKYLNTIRNSN